jgi:hypothetical protein
VLFDVKHNSLPLAVGSKIKTFVLFVSFVVKNFWGGGMIKS